MTYEVVTFNDGTEEVINMEITDKDNLTNSDIRRWADKHDIGVYIDRSTRLISLDTTDSQMTKKSVRNVINPRISSVIRLEVIDKNIDNMNEDSFDWSELSLEDQLYWSENWDGTGTIDDIDSDDMLRVVVELPWGETFTESYEIPTPKEDNKSLKRLVEYCGYNLSVLGDISEEIEGSDVPVHHENNRWKIEEESLTENQLSKEEARKLINYSSEQTNNDSYSSTFGCRRSTKRVLKSFCVWCCVAISATMLLWIWWQIALLLGVSALAVSVLVVGFAVIAAMWLGHAV